MDVLENGLDGLDPMEGRNVYDPPPAPKRVTIPLAGEWDADRIKALREHLHLTQGQFAERLGSRQQTVSEWECGRYAPRGMSRTILDAVAREADFEG